MIWLIWLQMVQYKWFANGDIMWYITVYIYNMHININIYIYINTTNLIWLWGWSCSISIWELETIMQDLPSNCFLATPNLPADSQCVWAILCCWQCRWTMLRALSPCVVLADLFELICIVSSPSLFLTLPCLLVMEADVNSTAEHYLCKTMSIVKQK